MIRNPFVLNDPGELRSLVEAAGFGDVVVEIERVAARFGDAEHFTERLLAGQPLAAQFAQATDEQRRAVSDDVNAALEPYGDGEHVAFEMPSLIAVARR